MVHQNSESYLQVKVKSRKHLDPLLFGLKESVHGMFKDHSSKRKMVYLGTTEGCLYLILII